MPLGTLDRTPPPLFKQGPSLLSKFVFFTCLSLFLMFADTRFEMAKTLRSSIATVLAPVNRVLSMPGTWVSHAAVYFESQTTLKNSEAALKQKLLLQTQQASQAQVLIAENTQLRSLLKLKATITTPSQAAQVMYTISDPYARKVVIDKGSTSNIALGSPVIDADGVIGQVVRVYPLYSEVALLTDNDQATPVLNVRTGIRSVMFGHPTAHSDVLELRFVSGTADIQAGDELITSGMDGVYPAGLAVAKIDKVERRTDSAFAKITCQAKANLGNVKHVMVLQPMTGNIPDTVHEAGKSGDGKKGAKK